MKKFLWAQRKNALALIFLGLTVALAGLINTPKQSVTQAVTVPSPSPRPIAADELTAQLTNTVAKPTAALGIYVEDVHDSTAYSYLGDRAWQGGSTQKLLIMAHLYHEASENRINLDESVTIKSSDIQNYGTGSLRYGAGKKQYTLRELVHLVGKESDNTSAHVLAEKLGKDKTQAYGESIGLTNTIMADNLTTPHDMVRLLLAIERGNVANPALTEELRSTMRGTLFFERLPSGLPPGTNIYSKSGDALDGGLHDIGVVKANGRAYAVAVFTRNVEPPKLPRLSKDIYDVFSR